MCHESYSSVEDDSKHVWRSLRGRGGFSPSLFGWVPSGRRGAMNLCTVIYAAHRVLKRGERESVQCVVLTGGWGLLFWAAYRLRLRGDVTYWNVISSGLLLLDCVN